jgi:hypothetical protein
MNQNKILKYALILVLIGVLAGGAVAAYIFLTPHRDVQDTKIDFKLSASAIVAEYLEDSDLANKRFLDEQGESKVLQITGTVADISEDFNGQKVVLLKSANDKAGVSCTFLATNDPKLEVLSVGQIISVKGMITAGASYDEDLGFYENVLLDQCSINQ